MKLAELGLLDPGRMGRAFLFDSPFDLRDRLSGLDRRAPSSRS
jgi:hypothetical protein